VAHRAPERLAAACLALSLGLSACVSISRVGEAPPSDVGAPSPGVAATANPPSAAATPPGSAPSSADSPSSGPVTVPRLGYIALDERNLFAQSVSSGIRAAAEAAGVELIECDPGWTREGVTTCAGQLGDVGVDGLISFQPFADLASDVCAAARDVPTVGVVFEQGPCQVSRLIVDQAESGRLAGAAVGRFAEREWECQVSAYLSLESSDADPDGRARMAGYRAGFEESCPLPDRVILLDGADRFATAQTQVGEQLEQLRGRRNVVVGLNEDAILGAMAAASAAGRGGQVWYSGQLADPGIRQRIACDEQYIASVAQFPERFGDILVPTLVDALRGQAVPESIQAPLELVTAGNVRELFPDTPACDP